MNGDLIDRLNSRWREVLPELDPSGLELVGRVLVLAQHLEKSVNTALAAHGLSLGQFDILATLRRAEPEGRLTPTQLLQNIALTSGGMTSRLDRLEQAGLIRREEDPGDRRGVVIVLTATGRSLIDAATATRFAEATNSLPKMSAKEKRELANLLRKWLSQYS